MKRILSTILLCVTVLCAYSQEDITLFFLNDGTFKGFYDEEIDSITYSHLDLDSIWHTDAVVQEVWLADSVVRIPVEKIDSICHRVPDPVYRPGVVKIDERYLPYIQSVDGLTITFSSSLPKDLQPHKNDVLLYEGSSELFPEGFAGKVVTEGTKIICDEVGIQDVYDKLVLFGNYILVDKNNGNESASYRLQRLKGTKYVEDAGGGGGGGSWGDDDEDYGIDNWRLGYKELKDIKIGTIKKPIKIDLNKIHTSINIDYEVTPIISIELAWDLYALSKTWGIYYKRNIKANYKNKYYIKYSRDTKPDKDSEKTFWNSFWKGYEPNWIEAPDKEGDDKDDDVTQSLYILNKEVPIPEFPLVKIGVKLGMFCQPKLEGELRAGWETSGNIDRTYIYRLDRGNLFKRGESMDFKGPEDSETSMILDGSVKGSLWLGAVAGLRFNFGFGQGNKLEGVTEEANFRFGPYAEFELKADFSEAVKNRSMYSLVQDSKCKEGWKLGIDANFTAKIAGVIDFKWTQFSWSPNQLIDEHSLYFYPKFDAPKYSINGNSLRCWTNVNRVTFPNTIGYVLLYEDGTEAGRKYLDESYSFRNDDVKYADINNPYQLVLTFDNLDFVNHRYTIVPTTRLFGWKLFGLDVPEEQRTVVLCPNSNHPHLIDMGLPSGTKWLCTNVYANAPEDAGGYYQWGNPYKSHVYNEVTYRAPTITTADYQGTKYDAATANLGDAYSTPTLKQFKELLDNCTSSLRYSTWGDILGSTKGLYLKGRNGGNLYLPFSGFMKDTKIFNESKNVGFYLLSDALDSNNEPNRKAINVTDNLVVADAKAHGYTVRPVGSANTGQLSFSHQEVVWEGVYIGQESGQTIVVSNNGSTPVDITVAQTIAPFRVDDASLGKFTVKPKERLSVLVYFSPSEEKEYTSVLTLSYETGNACVVSKVPLKGKGIDPVAGNSILVMQEAIKFENVEVGQSERRYLTIVNNGTESEDVNLKIEDPYLLSNYGGEYGGGGRWLRNLSFTMAPNSQKMFVIHFDPTTVGRFNSEITMTSNGIAGGEIVIPVFCNVIEVQEDPSFHLSPKTIDVYVNDDEIVEIHNGSGDYDIINNYPDIVESDINVPHIAHMPKKRDIGGDVAHPIEYDMWYVTGKKVGKAVLKVKDKKTNEVLSLNVEVKRAPSLLLSAKTVEVPMGEYNSSIEIQSGSGWYNITSENPEIATAVKNDKSVSWVDEYGVAHGGTFVEIQGLKVGSTKVTVKDMSSLEEVTLFVIVTNSSYISAEAVDLGLPSGTKWASFNLGATKPEEYGDFYAWGEITPKENYSWSTYKWCDGTQHSMNKYCYDSNYGKIDNKTVLELTDDAAYISLGSGWRLPTREQQNELRDNCDWEWTTYNGVAGMKVKSRKSDAFIFLPACGYKSGTTTSYASEYGYYQSASLDLKNSDDSYYFYFNSGGHYWQDFSTTVGRDVGFSVRPVMSPNGKPDYEDGGNPSDGDGRPDTPGPDADDQGDL